MIPLPLVMLCVREWMRAAAQLVELWAGECVFEGDGAALIPAFSVRAQ